MAFAIGPVPNNVIYLKKSSQTYGIVDQIKGVTSAVRSYKGR